MEEKAPGGKLVRLTVKTGRHPGVILSGDFFIYPEEGIALIEKTLSRLDGSEPMADIEAALRGAIRDGGIELIGLDVPLIARLFKGAPHVESHGD